MRNIWTVFKTDIRTLSRCFFACVVVVAIALLPSLYAWLNIYSNWDPYGNTGGISIAVASLDEGYTDEDGVYENKGQDVVDDLREATSINWVIVDTEEQAKGGVESGDYYAAVVIDKEFSRNMFRMLTDWTGKPAITYYENAKKNAVATKITDTAVETLKRSISENYLEVVISGIMEQSNLLAADLTEDDPETAVKGVFYQARDLLAGCRATMDAFEAAGQGGAGVQNFVFRGMDEADAVLLRKRENLPAAHRLADGDTLGDGRCGRNGLRLHLPFFRRAQQRVAVLALQGDDLREMVDAAAILQVLERVDRTEEERADGGKIADIMSLPETVVLAFNQGIDADSMGDMTGASTEASDGGAAQAMPTPEQMAAMTPEQLAELKAIVRSLQKDAVIVEAQNGEVPMEELLDTDRFDFMRAYNSAAWIEAMEHPEEHDDPEVLEYDIETFVYSRRKPFDLQKFTDFVEQEWPDEVIRVKGPLWQTGDPDMCYMFEQAGHQMRLMENGLFVDSAPEGEKQKIIDENPEIMQIWDDETGDRMTSLCIIGRHMDKDALIAALDACLTDWHRA